MVPLFVSVPMLPSFEMPDEWLVMVPPVALVSAAMPASFSMP
jgi:hypothetical protein